MSQVRKVRKDVCA